MLADPMSLTAVLSSKAISSCRSLPCDAVTTFPFRRPLRGCVGKPVAGKGTYPAFGYYPHKSACGGLRILDILGAAPGAYSKATVLAHVVPPSRSRHPGKHLVTGNIRGQLVERSAARKAAMLQIALRSPRQFSPPRHPPTSARSRTAHLLGDAARAALVRFASGQVR